jgi:hypothetical protein
LLTETNVLSPGYPEYLKVSIKGKMVPQILQSQRIPKQQKPEIQNTHHCNNKKG